ncbi:acyltransferase family protein [Leifsonia sp. EB34]|uniref:acyltransferase family protein n=1 Tax=Leifsonia sp. EB34 TaxID=3156303 RepID=UPI00351482A1
MTNTTEGTATRRPNPEARRAGGTPSDARNASPVPERTKLRLDLQGLRALAVGLVVLNHAFEWPAGGFVGVDIFFVISGFLMTSVLHREYERSGRIRFLAFYRRRIRRLIPASVAVLAATVFGAWALFGSGRFMATVWDALASLFFVSNWRFAAAQTDYFAQGAQTSPLQHYWSLSLEEQYYLVWPLAILLIALLVARGQRPRVFAALITFGITVALFLLALQLTQADSATAYFITPARLWELSVGATVALCMPWFSRLPSAFRPAIALLALAGMIAASAITPSGQGFPAPWAALAVLSAAAFIAFPWQPKRSWLNPLDNPVLSYIGDISYSLYLWHFPALILVTELARGTSSYGTLIPALESIALSLVFAALSYRFIEEPVRRSSWLEPKKRKRRRKAERGRRLGVLALSSVSVVVIGVLVVAFTVDRGARNAPAESATPPTVSDAPTGETAVAALGSQLAEALAVTSWPELTPSMDAILAGYKQDAEVTACGVPPYPGIDRCTWGPADARTSVAIVGDSTSMAYVAMLRAVADSSNGQIRVTSLGMFGCPFVDIETANSAANVQQACPGHKTQAVEDIKSLKPDVLLITNTYTPYKTVGGDPISQDAYSAGMRSLLEQIEPSVGRLAMLAPPPADKDVRECFSPRSTPKDCVSTVQKFWTQRAVVEDKLAHEFNGVWFDSRPMFCVGSKCPAFAAGIPVKFDLVHVTEEYARHIAPAFVALLSETGVNLTGG